MQFSTYFLFNYFVNLQTFFNKINLNNMNSHEIDFQIFGEEMQYVEIELDPYETVIAEAGSFMMMDSEIKMATILVPCSRRQCWGHRSSSSSGHGSCSSHRRRCRCH